MRLGAQTAKLDPESQSAKAYGTTTISERHRHRYELNNRYRQQFAANGLQIAGASPDGLLAEIVELPGHRWFVAVQYHPEFKSKPTAAHPLFAGFISAAVDHHAAKHGRVADASGGAAAAAAKKTSARPSRQEA
jgi:CTP synthase